jgi:hypothetical protein
MLFSKIGVFVKKIIVLLTLLSSFSVFAAAICGKNQLPYNGNLTINDNKTITLSGLSSVGVPDGVYDCSVSGVLSKDANIKESRLNCSQGSHFICGYLKEGPNEKGINTASVEFFDIEGKTFLTSNCVHKK